MNGTQLRHRLWPKAALERLLEKPWVRRWLLPPSMQRIQSRPTTKVSSSKPMDSMAVWKATHGHEGSWPPPPGKRPASTLAKAPPRKKGGRRRATTTTQPSDRPRALVSERRPSAPSAPPPNLPDSTRPPIASASNSARPAIEVSTPSPQRAVPHAEALRDHQSIRGLVDEGGPGPHPGDGWQHRDPTIPEGGL